LRTAPSSPTHPEPSGSTSPTDPAPPTAASSAPCAAAPAWSPSTGCRSTATPPAWSPARCPVPGRRRRCTRRRSRRAHTDATRSRTTQADRM